MTKLPILKCIIQRIRRGKKLLCIKLYNKVIAISSSVKSQNMSEYLSIHYVSLRQKYV